MLSALAVIAARSKPAEKRPSRPTITTARASCFGLVEGLVQTLEERAVDGVRLAVVEGDDGDAVDQAVASETAREPGCSPGQRRRRSWPRNLLGSARSASAWTRERTVFCRVSGSTTPTIRPSGPTTRRYGVAPALVPLQRAEDRLVDQRRRRHGRSGTRAHSTRRLAHCSRRHREDRVRGEQAGDPAVGRLDGIGPMGRAGGQRAQERVDGHPLRRTSADRPP